MVRMHQLRCSSACKHARPVIATYERCRDVRLENLGISGDGNVQLVDLAATAAIAAGVQPAWAVGAHAYCAPEHVHGLDTCCERRAGTWGIGVALYRLALGRFPFECDPDGMPGVEGGIPDRSWQALQVRHTCSPSEVRFSFDCRRQRHFSSSCRQVACKLALRVVEHSAAYALPTKATSHELQDWVAAGSHGRIEVQTIIMLCLRRQPSKRPLPQVIKCECRGLWKAVEKSCTLYGSALEDNWWAQQGALANADGVMRAGVPANIDTWHQQRQQAGSCAVVSADETW